MVEIKATALKYELLNNPHGLKEATTQTLLHESSLQHTSPSARAFSENKGVTVGVPDGAYTLLASYVEAETVDRYGTQILAKLKRALHAELALPYKQQARKLEIA